jgi:hypothetical protein
VFCCNVLQVPVTLPRTGFFISKTEVPAFIPRDDMMDQILRWALIEAEEGGQRNFGMPMKVQFAGTGWHSVLQQYSLLQH